MFEDEFQAELLREADLVLAAVMPLIGQVRRVDLMREVTIGEAFAQPGRDWVDLADD